MLSSRSVWMLASVAALAALGCQGSGGGNASPAASVSSAAAPLTTSTASATPKHRLAPPMRHGGLGSSLFRAARDLDLTPAQQDSLDKIEASLKADDDGIRTAMKAFRTDLVAGVRGGKLDTAKLTSDDAAVDKAMADHRSKEDEALDSLHALLDAGQRTTLVAAVRARQAEREARMTSWMRERAADAGAPGWSKKRVDKLTADLALDPGQQKQVAAIVGRSPDAPTAAAMQSRLDDRKKRVEALLTAFGGETFDAAKLDLAVLPDKGAHEPMDHMVAFFTQLVPVLHPDQRDKLATSLDHPFGAGGRGAEGAPARSPADDMAFPFSEPGDRAGDEPSSSAP